MSEHIDKNLSSLRPQDRHPPLNAKNLAKNGHWAQTGAGRVGGNAVAHMSEITELLGQMSDDNPGAMSELMARVYGELHRLAAAYMRRERGDHTLQTTALVHEAYLRLVGQRDIAWKNRAHFLGVAAQMMRRVLVDHARAHLCRRRGGPQQRVSLDEVCISPRTHSADLVALDEALTRLAQIDARQAQIVELRFFGGLTAEETAKILGVSTKTVNRDWLVARAWLHGEIAGRQ